MKKLFIIMALVLAAVSFAQEAVSTILFEIPFGNGKVFTVTTQADAQTVKEGIDAISFLIAAFQADFVHAGIFTWIIAALLIIGLICTLVCLVIWITPTKADDIFLNEKVIPFFLKWVKPIINAMLKFKSGKK